MTKLNYDITTAGYYWRGKQNLETYIKIGSKPYLIYSALEYRCCIERVLFEHLALLKIDDLTKAHLKLYRAKDIRNTILEIEPDFLMKLEYINMHFEAYGLPNKVFIPDLDLFNRLYGQLGNYLHSQKEPATTADYPEWWNNFLRLIEEADGYLQQIQNHEFGSFDLNERGMEIFKKMQIGEITRKQTIQIIRDEIKKELTSSPFHPSRAR